MMNNLRSSHNQEAVSKHSQDKVFVLARCIIRNEEESLFIQ